MADNVLFKRGLQANLPTSSSIGNKAIVDGAFYLTTDTNRLYVGKGNSLALLNQTVQIIPKVNDLPGKAGGLNAAKTPSKDDFYYCTLENVLAVYDGVKWVQINPDTNNTIKVDSVTIANPDKTTEGQLTYKATIVQNKYNKDGSIVANTNGSKVIPDVTFDLVLKATDLEDILHDPASVGLETTAGADPTIKTKGTGSDSASNVQIKGGGNVTVNAKDSVVTVSAKDTTYSLGVDSTTTGEGEDKKTTYSSKIVLTDNEGTTNAVEFAAGSELTAKAENGKITYSHSTVTCTDTPDTKINKLSAEGTVDVVTDVTVNAYGHVTGVTTKRYQLPTDKDTTISTITNTSGSSGWSKTITDTAGNKKVIDFSTDAAGLKTDLEGQITNGLADLEKQITDGLAAANTALTYKGTISSYSELNNKSGVEVGDVYLLSKDDSVGGYTLGDMFIAVAGKDAIVDNGVIKENPNSQSGTKEVIVWTHVPSGDELNTDTLFKGDVTVTAGNKGTGKVTYAWSSISGAANAGTTDMPTDHEDLAIEAGLDIEIASSTTNEDGVIGAVLNHTTYNTPTTSTSSESSKSSFTAVTEITTTNGHVTGLATKTFTPETYGLSGSNNSIKLTTGSGSDVDSVSVAGDGNWITAGVSANALSISHGGPVATGATNKSVTNGTSGDGKLTAEGTLNILTGIKYDSKGHVVEATTGSVTLPKDEDTTYSMYVGSAATSTSAATTAASNPYVLLKDKSGSIDEVQIKGDGGSLSVTGKDKEITVSLVWGSF